MARAKKGENKKASGKVGGPEFVPTEEHIAAARHYLGRKQYGARVADSLMKKFKIGMPSAYKIIDAAREQIVAELKGEGKDPFAAMFAFYESIIADGSQEMGTRLNAANSVVKMLGLERVMRKSESGDVEAYIMKLAAAQVARQKAIEDAIS